MKRKKILTVDDEKDIVEFLSYNIERDGFKVICAYDGVEAMSKLKKNPDLVVLDIMMPKMDGYDVLRKIRSQADGYTPVIFLTAKSGESNEIKGLELGGDDYIEKPISPRKLVARVKTILRRSDFGTDITKPIKIGPLEIDKAAYTVTMDNTSLNFPKKEFQILAYLASNPGKVLSRENILSEIWGEEIYVVDRTIDVHVRKIREKLNHHSELIETIKGVGYRFKNFG